MPDSISRSRRKGIAAPLAAVVLFAVAALALRLPGLDHGAPRFLFHPDVAKQAVVARDFFRGNPRPGVPSGDVELRYYPYGAAVALGRVLRAGALLDGVPPERFPSAREPEERWLWAWRLRVLGLLVFLVCGSAAVFAVERRLGWLPAAALGLFLAADPLLVEHAHYGMNDVPLAALLLLGWVLQPTTVSDRRNAGAAALASGVALGLAFGVKYQALIGLCFPLLSLRVPSRRLARSIAATVGFALGVWCTTPLLFAGPIVFARGVAAFLAWQASVTGMDPPIGTQLVSNGGWLARFLFVQPTGWLVPAAILGFVRSRRQPAGEPAVDPLSGAVFAVSLSVLLVTSRDLMRAADLLPAVPAVAVLAAHALAPAYARHPDRASRLALLIVLVPLIAQLARGASTASAFTRPDTRLRALAWLEAHAQPETRFLFERYSLPDGPLPGRPTRARYLFEEPTTGPLASGDFDLVVSSSLASDRFSDPLSPFASEEARAFYARLERDLPLVAEFEDRPLDFAHPRVTIRGRTPVGIREPTARSQRRGRRSVHGG